MSVSLVQTVCQQGVKPTNNLRIFNRQRDDGVKKGIAVCSKALALNLLEDNSLRFIEWIELLRALGAEKIGIGVISAHPNLMKVSEPLLIALFLAAKNFRSACSVDTTAQTFYNRCLTTMSPLV